MQIAGTVCESCHQSIAFVADGLACPKCNATYHKSCLTVNACPTCGADLEKEQSAIQERKEEELAQVKRQHTAGKVILVCIGAILLCGFRIFASVSRGEPPRFWMFQAITIVVMVAIIIQTYVRNR